MDLLICLLVLLWIFSPINITKEIDENGNINIKIKCGKNNKDRKDK